MIRIDQLALTFVRRPFVDLLQWCSDPRSYTPSQIVQKSVYDSILYFNLNSVVDCSLLNWVEQQELRQLSGDHMSFVKMAEPGLMRLDFKTSFIFRMGVETWPMPMYKKNGRETWFPGS